MRTKRNTVKVVTLPDINDPIWKLGHLIIKEIAEFIDAD